MDKIMVATQSIAASSHGKPSVEPKAQRKSSKAESEVTEIIGATSSEVFSLHDIALRFPRCPFNVFTMVIAVSALADRLSTSLQTCKRILPAKHPALQKIKEAELILDSINAAMASFEQDGDGCEYTVPKETAGTILKLLVVELGKSLERVEISCGHGGSWGYLQNGVEDPFRRLNMEARNG